jgi:hypothetical protein
MTVIYSDKNYNYNKLVCKRKMQRVIKDLCQKKTSSRASLISRAVAFDTHGCILILQQMLSTASQTTFENSEKTPSNPIPQSTFHGHSSFLKSIDLSNPSYEDRKKFSKIIREVVKTRSSNEGMHYYRCWALNRILT